MLRLLTAVLGLLALIAGIAAFAVRFVPIANHLVLCAAAIAPYLALGAPVAVALSVLGRRPVGAVIALVVTGALVWQYLPRYVRSEAVGSGVAGVVDVRLLTTNLFLGQADPRAFASLARDAADVVTVQEMTAPLAAALSAAGMESAFPHRVLRPDTQASGVGIWSKYPIADSWDIDGYTLPMIGARIRVPGAASDVTVLSMHLGAPWPQPIDYWLRDTAQLPTLLAQVAESAGAGAVVAAGDFNATADMAQFRALLADGYTDAAVAAGAGLTRSYPAGRHRVPLIGIDHILLRNCAPASLQTVVAPGTDHRGLLATVRVPVDIPAR